MKLFFLIVCHKITPSLLYNLKKFSTFKNSKVLVHIDKKSKFSEDDLLKAENIIYMKEHLDIQWGSISQVNVTYKMLLTINSENYDYVSLMSGEDLFIKSEEEFISFLSSHIGLEFIGVQKDNYGFYNPNNRFMYKYPTSFFSSNPSLANKFIKSATNFLFKIGLFQNKQKLPYKSFYKGSNWFTLSKQAVKLIINEIDTKKLLDYFQNSFCIDEVIFQTILINNGFLNKIYLINKNVDDNKMSLRYVNWIDGPEYPKLLNKKDLEQQFENNIFFIRKISSYLSEEELNSIFKKDLS